MITVIDYGLGNVRAFVNVYKRLNVPCRVASKPEDLAGATHLILPGVGAFDEAMQLLQASGMREALNDLVIERKVPVLGICVGMQMLANASEEGKLPGLGWISGTVRKLGVSKLAHKTRLPHMGWNTIHPTTGDGLFQSLGEGARFYFLHSYYFECSNQENSMAVTEYGETFSCAVNSGNVYGVQFHPEKSHANGVRLLKNFGEVPTPH